MAPDDRITIGGVTTTRLGFEWKRFRSLPMLNDDIETVRDVVVKMEVTVTVTPPNGTTLDTDHAIRLAMSAVTQFHEVACGREISDRHNISAWAKIYAEVSDNDCEIVEGI